MTRKSKSMNFEEAILNLPTREFRSMLYAIKKDDPELAERLRNERRRRRNQDWSDANAEQVKETKRRWWSEVGSDVRRQRNRQDAN